MSLSLSEQETKQLTASERQQLAAKALARALEETITAQRELEAIHPMLENSTEHKEIKAIGSRLKESMLSVLQMKGVRK